SGYFPRELPPPFNTHDLADSLKANPLLPFGGSATDCVRHNLLRHDGTRRPLKVPNPRSFIGVAQEFEKHWALISTHLRRSPSGPVRNTWTVLSRPVVTRSWERAFRPRFKIGERPKYRAFLWPTSRFVLTADVSQY